MTMGGGNSLGSAVLDLSVDDSKLNRGLDGAEGRSRKWAKAVAGVALGASTAIVGIGVASFNASKTFNTGMANVASLIPGNTARVKELRDGVLELAPVMGKSTDDMTAGLYQVISAFGDTNDTLEVLEANARAATAGLATTEQAIGLTSAVTKAYGDTSLRAVRQVSDLATMTVRLGQTTFPELAASIGRVTPLAVELGVAQEELFAVMATGTGVTGTAADVSTQLRGVLQALMVPTANMTDLYKEMGVASGEALIEQMGFPGALNAIIKAADKSGEPLQKFISSIEGQTLAMALAGPQQDALIEKLAQMEDSAGATDEAFREQTQGINAAGFKWDQFTSLVNTSMIRIGDTLAPIFSAVIGGLIGLFDAGSELSRLFSIGLNGGMIAGEFSAIEKAAFAIGQFIRDEFLPRFHELSDWFETTGGPALTTFKDDVLGALATTFERDIQPRLEAFGKFMRDPVIPAVVELGRFIKDDLLPPLRDFAGWMADHKEILGAIIAAYATWKLGMIAIQAIGFAQMVFGMTAAFLAMTTQLGFATAAQTLFNIALSANPIGLVVIAIAGLVAAGVLLYKNWDTVTAAAGKLWEGIKSAFSAATSWVGEKVGEIVGFFRALPGRLSAALSTLRDDLSRPFRGAFNAIRDIANGFIRRWNTLELKIPSVSIPFGPDIPGFSVGVVDLPEFARGGIVPGPIGAPVPILAHAGETILPAHRGVIGGGFGGNHYEITVHAPDPQTAADYVVRAIVSGVEHGRLNPSILR